MRHLVRMALLALAVVAGVALPAAAESGDNRHWFESGPRHYYRGEEAAPRGSPAPIATTTRKRRRAGRPTAAIELIVPAQHAARSGKSTRGKRIAGRHGKGHKAVAQQRKRHRKAGGGRRREAG